MIAFLRHLWPVLPRPTQRRLLQAAIVLACITMVEGLGLLLLVNLLQLLSSGNFSADSAIIDFFRATLETDDGKRIASWIGGLAAFAYIARAVASVYALRWNATIALRAEATVVRRLAASYLYAPLAVHLRRNSAEFARTINMSTRAVFGPAFVAVVSSLADIVSLVLVVAILVLTDPVMALVASVYFGLVALVWDKIISARLSRASAEIHREQAAVFRHTMQSIAAIREIQVSTSETFFADAIDRTRRTLMRPYRTTAMAHVVPRFVLEIAMVGGTMLVATYAFTTKDTASATSTLAIFLAGGFRVIAPVNKILGAITAARTAMRPLTQIRTDLDAYQSYVPSDDDTATRLPAGPISVQDVHFSYDGESAVLKGISLRIEVGEAIAIVGSSGAGKSTLVDLILGLLEPSGGQILVGGHDLRAVRRQWQRSIGYVPQLISMLDDSIRANIALGQREVNDREIWRALDLAQLGDMVRSLPDGLDTRVGERGVRFSGGQRQRLGIARALYHRPNVLILDEATSSLDNDTERRFIDVIESLHGGITTVTIAHRLSTIQHVDRVVFIDAGRVVKAGTFDELVRDVPHFAHLAELAGIGVRGG